MQFCVETKQTTTKKTLRPADIPTSAVLPGRLAALDIGITSPDASGAGDDCCEAMFKRKRKDYKAYLEELEEHRDVIYKPMIWSTWGRAHPETQVMLESMAIIAARRRRLRDHRLILRRVKCAIGVQLARRAARMMFSCLPQLSDEEVSTLFGGCAIASASEMAGRPEPREVVLFEGDADVPHVC